MKFNVMICKSIDKVFKEIKEENQNYQYFKELDNKWLNQTIQMIVKNTEGYFNTI